MGEIRVHNYFKEQDKTKRDRALIEIIAKILEKENK